MRFTPLVLATFLPIAALATPVPVEWDGTDITPATEDALVKRANIVGTVDADELKYRRCPRVIDACEAVGEYPRGHRITMVCFTTSATTTVHGDA